jgi:hypothetical protein
MNVKRTTLKVELVLQCLEEMIIIDHYNDEKDIIDLIVFIEIFCLISLSIPWTIAILTVH